MLGIEQTDITEKISDYAVGFSYADASESAITSAKLFTLECIGHMLSGARQPVGGLVVEMIRELGATEQACVFGGAFRTSIAEAAYVNGALAHADELEALARCPAQGSSRRSLPASPSARRAAPPAPNTSPRSSPVSRYRGD
jgi:hypothetical protein